MKHSETWTSDHIGGEMTLTRWGHYGTPALVFPTAGGDSEEIERMHVVDACADLLEAGRVKLYSCDSIAGKAMIEKWGTPEQRHRLLQAFHRYVRNEVVPAIRADCGGVDDLEVIVSGASIGAFNAVAMVCRFPDVFSTAIGMSGTYDLQKMYEGTFTEDFFYSSPIHFVPGLEGELLDRVRQRFVLLASGEGAWESIDESWRMAKVLGEKGIPNRVDSWGTDWEHDWGTWRAMLPVYLDEFA